MFTRVNLFTTVYSCLPMFTCVLPLLTRLYLCLVVFIYVYLCLLVFSYVYNDYSSIFTYVDPCLLVFSRFLVFTYVYPLSMLTTVYSCLRLPMFTRVYLF